MKIQRKDIRSLAYKYNPVNQTYEVIFSTDEDEVAIAGLYKDEKEKLVEGLDYIIHE